MEQKPAEGGDASSKQTLLSNHLEVPKSNKSNWSESEYESDEEVDPFSHQIEMSRFQWIRTYALAVLLFPFRMLATFFIVILAWALCSLAILGLTKKELEEKPLAGWRRQLRRFSGVLGRIMMFCCGFHPVVIKGRQASSREAPILVAAPHSTFFDAFATFWSHSPYIVSRIENKAIPFLGKCIECNQALFVSRENPNSRRETLENIRKRSSQSDVMDWPQLIIFPEGSTSNRKALMTFKVGAFLPAKPVQPVIIKYPNELDTVTWTWNQSYGAWKVLWMTLSQPFTTAELQYLPVYYPSEEEIAHPEMYARNVRAVMSAALGVPVSDGTFEEAKAKFGKRKKKRRTLIFGGIKKNEKHE